MIIGLTGGIASGKSTVSSLFVQLGAALVDADQIAREVVLPGQPALEEVAAVFGQAVLQADGRLNRKKLGEIVFADPAHRKKLESILHPAIRSKIKAQMYAYEQEEPNRLVIVDIPLLYESGLQELFQEVVLVYIPAEEQLNRLTKRDGMSRQEAEARLKAQMPIEEKRALADYIIDNSGTLEQTKEKVQQYWQEKTSR